MPRIPALNAELLNAALDGLEAQRQRVEQQISEIRRLLGAPAAAPRPVAAPVAAAAPRKRAMSAAARKRIADAQKKRWQEFRKKSASAAQKPAAPARKHRLSPAGRRAIIEATKKRWAAVRAAKKAQQG